MGLDPDELLDIVDLAIEAGVYDEAYRAIVNFLWSAPGFIPLDEAERVSVEARRQLGDVTPPSSIAAYVELSRVNMLLLPAGRWHEVDEVIRANEPTVGIRDGQDRLAAACRRDGHATR